MRNVCFFIAVTIAVKNSSPMVLNQLERLGNWNPQLIRELKSRLKPQNLAIALTLSLVGQVLIGMSCIRSFNDSFNINWPLFWADVFVHLSWFSTLAVLGVGTYLLINDLAHEERRGTLNFLRLSPQPTQSILLGKLLGVPSLLYLGIILAVPLHLASGLAAQIPLSLILSYYGVSLASCLFFYSAALLYGLTCTWLGGFQAWLGSGIVLVFLSSLRFIFSKGSFLFTTLVILTYLVSPTSLNSYMGIPNFSWEGWKWFSLPLGESAESFIGFVLLNYGLCTYFLWRSLQRCFRDTNATILSKQQSYLFTAWFQLLTVGSIQGNSYMVEDTFRQCFTNLLLFLWLIAAVSPHRPALQDWANHRRSRLAAGKHFWNHSLMQDLIWGEKSPALVAIFLNLLIAGAMIVRLFFLYRTQIADFSNFVIPVIILSLNVIWVYAAVAQRILLMRTQKRGLWAVGTVASLIVLSPFISHLGFYLSREGFGLWSLPVAWFSPLPEFSPLPRLPLQPAITFFLVLFGQWSIIGFLSGQLMRQLRRVRESDDKALLMKN